MRVLQCTISSRSCSLKTYFILRINLLCASFVCNGCVNACGCPQMEELLQAFERDKAASQELHEQHERVVILEQAKRDKDLKAGLTMQQLGARLPTVERAVADLRSLSVLEQQINAMFENKADAVVFQAQLAALNHDLR